MADQTRVGVWGGIKADALRLVQAVTVPEERVSAWKAIRADVINVKQGKALAACIGVADTLIAATGKPIDLHSEAITVGAMFLSFATTAVLKRPRP